MVAPAYTTPELVYARLRLAPGGADDQWIGICVGAANSRVHEYLDRNTDPAGTWPPLVEPFPDEVVAAATNAALHIFRYKDAGSDIADAWGVEAPRLTSDPLGGQRHLLAAYRNPATFAPG